MLQERYEKSEFDKNSLRKEANELEIKLKRASDLVVGLDSEKIRWENDILQFESQIKHILGDSIYAAAFLAYCGPFTAEVRHELMFKWRNLIPSSSVSMSPQISLSSFLCDSKDVASWQLEGLPVDSFSLENGILVSNCPRWPLLIDPQFQAVKWIQKREGEDLLHLDYTSPISELIKSFEIAMKIGVSVLLVNFSAYSDPSILKILRSKLTGTVFLRENIVVSPTFKLYISTNISSPSFSSDFSSYASIINFSVTNLGLEEQLLSVFIISEDAVLEAEKHRLVQDIVDGKSKLDSIEDEILVLLEKSSGILLEDETMINTLNFSKKTSERIKEQLKASVEFEIKIDQTRNSYRPICTSIWLFNMFNSF